MLTLFLLITEMLASLQLSQRSQCQVRNVSPPSPLYFLLSGVLAPGTVTLMQTLLHKYTRKTGPYVHIYLAVFSFQISWLSFNLQSTNGMHTPTWLYLHNLHTVNICSPCLFQAKELTACCQPAIMLSAARNQHSAAAYLSHCCWICAPQPQVGGAPLLSTWPDCRGQRSSTSERKRYHSYLHRKGHAMRFEQSRVSDVATDIWIPALKGHTLRQGEKPTIIASCLSDLCPTTPGCFTEAFVPVFTGLMWHMQIQTNGSYLWYSMCLSSHMMFFVH